MDKPRPGRGFCFTAAAAAGHEIRRAVAEEVGQANVLRSLWSFLHQRVGFDLDEDFRRNQSADLDHAGRGPNILEKLTVGRADLLPIVDVRPRARRACGARARGRVRVAQAVLMKRRIAGGLERLAVGPPINQTTT